MKALPFVTSTEKVLESDVEDMDMDMQENSSATVDGMSCELQ